MAIYEATIERLNADGDGTLTDVRGCTVSIPGVLPGEIVRYRVAHVSPHEKRVWAVCESVEKRSPERREVPCATCWPTRGLCSGCPVMHMNDKLQASFKKQVVLDALKNAGINYINDIEYSAAPEPFGYRNRTDLVAGVVQGRPALGSYEPRSHRFTMTRNCPILRQPLNQAISACVKVLSSLHVPIFELGRNMKGSLRYVSFFANDAGSVLIDFVTTSDGGNEPQWCRKFGFELKKSFASLKGVSFSINDSANNAIRTAPSTTIWGESVLVEHYDKLETRLSASGFTQLNSVMAAKIYSAGREWLERQAHVVWDLYCGAGAFGRMLAPSHKLFGAEFSERAIAAAKEISKKDSWQNTFEVMNLDTTWPSSWTRPDVILVDPPRKGLSRLVIEKLNALQGIDLIYMSCNPESFAKNVAELDPHYEIQRISAFDMMPQTRHVEVLALLKPRKV